MSRRPTRTSSCSGLISLVRPGRTHSFAGSILTVYRICPRLPRRAVSVLHASAPAHLLHPIQRVVSARRARRVRCATLQPVHGFWCGPRHGDRSLHDVVPPRVPQLCLATLVDCLPGADQPRPREPLHAHVRDVDDGRLRVEPQERGLRSEQDLVSVLPQQGKHKQHFPNICLQN